MQYIYSRTMVVALSALFLGTHILKGAACFSQSVGIQTEQEVTVPSAHVSCDLSDMYVDMYFPPAHIFPVDETAPAKLRELKAMRDALRAGSSEGLSDKHAICTQFAVEYSAWCKERLLNLFATRDVTILQDRFELIGIAHELLVSDSLALIDRWEVNPLSKPRHFTEHPASITPALSDNEKRLEQLYDYFDNFMGVKQYVPKVLCGGVYQTEKLLSSVSTKEKAGLVERITRDMVTLDERLIEAQEIAEAELEPQGPAHVLVECLQGRRIYLEKLAEVYSF